jgi:hypothetical protein
LLGQFHDVSSLFKVGPTTRCMHDSVSGVPLTRGFPGSNSEFNIGYNPFFLLSILGKEPESAKIPPKGDFPILAWTARR